MPKYTVSGLVRAYWPIAVGLAGAIGAVGGFLLKDLPLLRTRVAGSSELTWSDTSVTDVCRATFHVSFENTGTTGLSVSKVRVRAWLTDVSPSKQDKASYFDAAAFLDKAELVTDKFYSSDARDGPLPPPFIGSYYAGMQYENTFEWDVPRKELRRFYVYVELFPSKSATQTNWYFTRWSGVCEDRRPDVLTEALREVAKSLSSRGER